PPRWSVALLNYLDRQMLASMKFSVMHDIPSIGKEAHWGLLLAWFKWVYALLSPFGGYIADRFSRRGVIVGSLFVWSAVTWMTGHAHTFHELLVTRALMGISEAFYIPGALALIAEFHSGTTRSRAVGIHHTFIHFAGVVLYLAGLGGMDCQRLDAGDSQAAFQHRPGKGWGIRNFLRQPGHCVWRIDRRLAGRSLDAPLRARTHLHQRYRDELY